MLTVTFTPPEVFHSDPTLKCRFLYFTLRFAPSVSSPEKPVKKEKKATSLYFILLSVRSGFSLFFVLFFWRLQTFLVRKCSSSQRKVLCLRVTADRSASSVQECFICEEDSSEYKAKLDGSVCSLPAATDTRATPHISAHFNGWSDVGEDGPSQ